MPINNLWTAGGVVGIPLLGFSPIAIALIIERIIFWWRIKNKQRRVIKEVLSSVVVINADTKVEHGTVVKVMDRLRQVPGARMAIAADWE